MSAGTKRKEANEDISKRPKKKLRTEAENSSEEKSSKSSDSDSEEKSPNSDENRVKYDLPGLQKKMMIGPQLLFMVSLCHVTS